MIELGVGNLSVETHLVEPHHTMTSSYQILNNQAVTCMAFGKIHEASRLFHAAYESFKIYTAQKCHERQSPSIPRFHAVAVNAKLVEMAYSFSPNNPFLVYDKVFLLSEQDESISHSDVAIVLLYNLGLSLLCSGVSKPRHAKLYQALFLYKMADAIVVKECFCISSRATSSEMAHVHLAMWCNQAFLLAHFGWYEQVLHCTTHIFTYLRQPGTVPTSRAWFFFYQHVFHVQQGSALGVHFAPAA